jgi:hypothetical protein
VPRSLKDLALACRDAVAEFEGREGRAPTAAELADALGVDVERVLDARLASDSQRPDSLDRSCATATTTPGRCTSWSRPRTTRSGGPTPPCPLGLLTGRLGARDREILRLRFEEDLTQSDIAARVGLSQMHVSRLLRNALDELASAAGGRFTRLGLEQRRLAVEAPRGTSMRRRYQLLDLDPDLGTLVPVDRRDACRRELDVEVRRLAQGPWGRRRGRRGPQARRAAGHRTA